MEPLGKSNQNQIITRTLLAQAFRWQWVMRHPRTTASTPPGFWGGSKMAAGGGPNGGGQRRHRTHRERRQAQQWAQLSLENALRSWRQLEAADRELLEREAAARPALRQLLAGCRPRHCDVLRRNVAWHADRLPSQRAPAAAWRQAQRGPRLEERQRSGKADDGGKPGGQLPQQVRTQYIVVEVPRQEVANPTAQQSNPTVQQEGNPGEHGGAHPNRERRDRPDQPDGEQPHRPVGA